MDTTDELLSRDQLIELIARVHLGAASSEGARAGRALAAQSKLPKIVAENLGAGFGQWDFFPEVSDIVDFALAYAPPSSEEELWAMARVWAADDAGGRHTLMALVGREILQHELRRIEVPKLRELFDEARPARVRELRESLGLAVPPGAASKRSRSGATAPRPKPAAAARAIPTRMPKPEFKRPPPAVAAPIRRFEHPKFGEGVLVSQEGTGADAKLTIKFSGGSKTLLARYVTERPPA